MDTNISRICMLSKYNNHESTFLTVARFVNADSEVYLGFSLDKETEIADAIFAVRISDSEDIKILDEKDTKAYFERYKKFCESKKEIYLISENLSENVLNPDNTDVLTCYSYLGAVIHFEQIAVIPYNNEVYCVLKPVEEMQGITDNEVIVFRVDQLNPTEDYLVVEMDEKTAMGVYEKYLELL